MAEERGADRSSIEIKTLIRKLHPKRGNHKDRIRQLNKFRNYVIGDRKSGPPEFYDDDLPILWLGAAAPAAYLEEVNDDLLAMGITGLLQACGTPSDKGTLKRSARHSMNLLKWLIMDWKEPGHKGDELNLFAKSFLSLDVSHYHHMQLDLHCIGDDRGGAKVDACEIIVQILTKHMDEAGEHSSPVMMEELVSRPAAQQEFELWTARHCSASVQDAIKKAAAARQSELVLQQRQHALANKAQGGAATDDLFLDESDHQDHSDGGGAEDETEESEDGFLDEDDVVAAMRKRKKSLRKELREAEGRGEITAAHGVAARWEDSQLAREQRARAASAARAGEHETVRDSQEAAQELMEREEERAKVLGKDPLGIVDAEDFDLAAIDKSPAEHLEQASHELQQDLQKADSIGHEKMIKKARGKKESLEAFVDRLGGIDAMENTANLQHSIVPTNPKFNPLLFLTLVHRTTKFQTLIGSMSRLSSKTENQVEQLQNLVRDNFQLFVRCAEGFEAFRQSSEDEVGLGLHERIDKLEAIAESCSFQAKKSFKPLLDNTSEVRKVQSSMSVLQRVAPILQVPALMRQHIENRRYSQALKVYRRVLVVDKSCKIELLSHVRLQAEECLLETRRALESRLAQDAVPVDDLLEGIRDIDELLQVADIAVGRDASASVDDSFEERGIFDIGGTVINIREHPPALACMLLQAAHFSAGVRKIILDAGGTADRIFAGEAISRVQSDMSVDTSGSVAIDEANESTKGNRGSGNQWKYDVLDARVLSTIKSVAVLRSWLPRLIRVGRAAREDEKRRAARIGLRRGVGNLSSDDAQLTAFEVFISNISPSVNSIVEHASFCALGSNSRSASRDIAVTFGRDSPEKLKALLKSPLPPSQSNKVAKELAELVQILSENSGGASALRPDRDSSLFQLSPLDECKTLADSAVVTIEKRRCIYAFDVCSRACSNRASGSGKFDADSLVHCLQNLAEQLSRPDECSNEVDKGCELVIRRCCEGLASYVRDRGDAARLNAVAECADVMNEKVSEIVREAAFLTQNGPAIQEVIMEDIMGLESAMFDEYLENIRQDVASSVRVGWLDTDAEASAAEGNISATPTFPAYLSASLLAIVRCRAQVEQALGDKVRTTEGVTYQHLSMATVADGVVEGICNEVMQRKQSLKMRQADRLANELEFLRNTLAKNFLGEEALSMLNSTLHLVASKAGRGRDYQRDGPDGLAALEELERLARVYVLCLGE